MSSHTEELVSKVLFNDLILENIFSNLFINELLPLRLTSKRWKISLNKRISEDKIVHFDTARQQNNLKNFKHLKELKLQNVIIRCWSNCVLREPDRILKSQTEKRNIFEELGKIGNQLRSLKLQGKMNIGLKDDITFLKNIFTSIPNLQCFVAPLQVDVPLFIEECKDFVYPSLRSLKIPYTILSSSDDGEAFVQQLAKIFPNLNTNFDCEIQDLNLLDLMNTKKKISHLKIRNYQDSFCPSTTDCLNILATVSLPLTTLELCCNPSYEPIVYTKILQNFSETLTNVKLLTDSKGAYMRYGYEGEIYLPPLQNIRKVWLGTPPFLGSKGLKFSWNLGKTIAKDFPLLEHLTLNLKLFDMETMKILNPNQHVLFGELWCKFWESFVPCSHENDEEWDFPSSLKYLKFVDLSFPNHWIGIEKNREWCSKFLRVYLKLYGNGGETKVIQDMIDWLK